MISVIFLFSPYAQIEPYGPEIMLTRVGYDITLNSGIVNVELEEGGPAPIFSCFSNTPVPTTFTWQRINDRSIPSDVIAMQTDAGLDLVWNRLPLLSDNSTYLCSAANRNGNRTVILNLRVLGELMLHYGKLVYTH